MCARDFLRARVRACVCARDVRVCTRRTQSERGTSMRTESTHVHAWVKMCGKDYSSLTPPLHTCRLNLSIECVRGSALSEETLQWALKLLDENIGDLYRSSQWGWDPKQKEEEMRQDGMFFAVARDHVSFDCKERGERRGTDR